MDIRSLSEKEMEELALSLGEKAFRGKQLFQWVHDKRVGSFDEMSNLSASFREKLKEKYTISGVTQVEKQVSQREILQNICLRWKTGMSLRVSG